MRSDDDLLEAAWGIIANADRGWNDPEWKEAAERWRDDYHERLDAKLPSIPWKVP